MPMDGKIGETSNYKIRQQQRTWRNNPRNSDDNSFLKTTSKNYLRVTKHSCLTQDSRNVELLFVEEDILWFMCSTVYESSNSNISERTRKRSGTSSVGGDSLAADRESGSADYTSKTKGRSAKYNVRLQANNVKNSRKPAKPGRIQRPNFRSLQNTIVLAPFHSLKKCFQTKLVDLYSFENMKNISHKTQTARRKNMSFEYDVFELNSSESMIKREGKGVRRMKQKSKYKNYCQCKKTGTRIEEKVSLKNSKRGRKTNRRRGAPGISENLKTKKRKLSGEAVSPTALKTELDPMFDYQANHQLIFSHANLSPSAKSSQSKYDSWETYSSSPTCKEEHMEVSLAVSTTSFDSYTDHYDKKSWNHSNSNRRLRKRGKCQEAVKGVDASFPLEQDATSSRHSIMHVQPKNSEGHLVDFIRREPQTQLISSFDPNQSLQPLQRQSKTKAKKMDKELTAGYYLRSLSTSTEKSVQKGNQESQEQKSVGNSSEHKALQIEVATQVEENTTERGSNTSLLTKSQKSTSNVYSSSLNISSDKIQDQHHLPFSQKTESSPRTITDTRPPSETSNLQRTDALEVHAEDTISQRSEGELNVSGEHSDGGPMEVIAGLSEHLQGPTNSQKSQGKDTDFIFGPRNTATRLGESCEFSFGLNWVFSDDEED